MKVVQELATDASAPIRHCGPGGSCLSLSGRLARLLFYQ